MDCNREPVFVYWIDDNLYLNITNQCSNNCCFCFRNYKQGIGDFNLKISIEPDKAKVVASLEAALHRRRWTEMVFCGFGEPTARLDLLLDLARWIRTNCPKTAIRLDTNGHGYLLNKGRDVAMELKLAGISKVSVSLNGHNSETYSVNCRPKFPGAFEATLDFIRKTRAAGVTTEVSAIRMPEVDLEKVEAVTKGLGVTLHIRDYIPCFW